MILNDLFSSRLDIKPDMKLKSLSSSISALRIHISPSIRKILEGIGGFICEERGQTYLKVSGSVTFTGPLIAI